MDSGHPPFMGLYLAAIWTFFGQSLAASHWAMLPFLIGIVLNLYWLLEVLLQKNILFSTLVVLMTPSIIGHAALVSPDVTLLCWFILAIRGIVQDKSWAIILATIGLCTISMRGMMTAGAIGLFYLYHSGYTWNSRNNLSFFKHFGPGYALAISFLVGHYLHSNWIGFHVDSPWGPSFHRVSLEGFLRNSVVSIWRFLDLGLIWAWAIIIPLVYRFRISVKTDKNLKILTILFLCTLLFLLPTALFFIGLNGHRYFLPCFTVVVLISIYLIDNYVRKHYKYLLILLLAGLFSGNFWIYPERISQGWDSTLAHIPYHHVRAEMILYLKDKNIPANEVHSFFPNISTFKYTDLHDKPSFVGFDQGDLPYILYSNVFNVEDQVLSNLNQLKVVKTIQCGPIYMKLYENYVR